MTPKVSVIVPVYKAEAYLYRCVDSILAQTFRDFEVLLIDDGSPDKSGEICDEYAKKDNRVRVFHKENGGVSSARQCGIDNALGEYTIHADPDDWVEPNMLEELYVKAKEEDSDMVICDFWYEEKNKLIYIEQKPSTLNNIIVLKELFQHLHGSCCNKLVRRTCYNNTNVSFDEDLSFCEDLYFHATLLKNPITISYLPKSFYHYISNNNPNSIVNTYTKQSYVYDKKLYNKFNDLLINTEAIELAKANMGYLIVERAFKGNLFSSKEFKIKCKEFKKYIFKRKRKGFIYSSILYISCLGFYKPIYNSFIFFKCLKKIINKL